MISLCVSGCGGWYPTVARVHGTANDTDAKAMAKQIINSPLMKAAVFGADPNWGRVVMAIGKPGPGREALLDPATIRIRYLEVLRNFQEQLKDGLRKHQVDYLSLPTDEPHAAALRSYLALRMR